MSFLNIENDITFWCFLRFLKIEFRKNDTCKLQNFSRAVSQYVIFFYQVLKKLDNLTRKIEIFWFSCSLQVLRMLKLCCACLRTVSAGKQHLEMTNWCERSACARTVSVRGQTQWPLNLALLFFFPSTYFSPRRGLPRKLKFGG